MTEVQVPRWLFSADNHVDEPVNLWDEHLPEHLKHLAPRVEIEGNKALIKVENSLITAFPVPEDFAAGADGFASVMKARDFEAISESRTPDARLRDLDSDGIWAEVMFPNRLMFMLYRLSNPEFQTTMCRLYNDWLADEFIGDSDRFIPIGVLPVLDVPSSVAEMRRLAKRGFRGVLMPAHSDGLPHAYNHPSYDDIWAAAADLGLVVHFHAGSGRDVQPARNPGGAVINFVLTTGGPQETVVYLCGSGVLARHPQLRVSMVETGSGWLAWILGAMDEGYREHGMFVKPRLDELPSEYFRRQGAVTFMNDPVGFHNVNFTGDRCLMWGSDYPHPEGTFPNSRTYLQEQLVGVPADIAANVLVHNASRLYRVDVPADAFDPVSLLT